MTSFWVQLLHLSKDVPKINEIHAKVAGTINDNLRFTYYERLQRQSNRKKNIVRSWVTYEGQMKMDYFYFFTQFYNQRTTENLMQARALCFACFIQRTVGIWKGIYIMSIFKGFKISVLPNFPNIFLPRCCSWVAVWES